MSPSLASVIKKLDRFPTEVKFLHRGNSQYRSFPLAILTILIWALVWAIVARIIIDFFSADSINVVRQDKIIPVNDTFPIRLDQASMFAIGVEQLDLRYEKAFTFTLSKMSIKTVDRNISEKQNGESVRLVPCTKTVWQKLGLGAAYDGFAMKMMLCPDPNVQLNISESSGLSLQMEKCTQSTPFNYSLFTDEYINQLQRKANGLERNDEWKAYYRNEYDLAVGNSTRNTTIRTDIPTYQSTPCYYDYYSTQVKKFRVNFFFLNTNLNPNKKQNYVDRFLDKKQYSIELATSIKLRFQAQLILGSYNVKTNNNLVFNKFDFRLEELKGVASFEPFTAQALILDQSPRDANLLQVKDTDYERMNNFLTIDIRGSSKMVQIRRSFLDLFKLQSDIWAQASSIFAGVAVLIFGFNEFKLKNDIIRNLYFKKQKKPLQIHRSKIWYGKYLMYKVVYNFLKSIGCCKLKNPCWQADEYEQWTIAEQHSGKVIDYRFIAMKQQIFEKACITLLGKEKYLALFLQDPQNLENQNNNFLLSKTAGQLRRLKYKKIHDAELLGKLEQKSQIKAPNHHFVNDQISKDQTKKKIDDHEKIDTQTALKKQNPSNMNDPKQDLDDDYISTEDYEGQLEDEEQIDLGALIKFKQYLAKLNQFKPKNPKDPKDPKNQKDPKDQKPQDIIAERISQNIGEQIVKVIDEQIIKLNGQDILRQAIAQNQNQQTKKQNNNNSFDSNP